MANPVEVRFQVTGLEQVKAGTQQVTQSLRGAASAAQQMSTTTTRAFVTARQGFTNLATGLAGVAGVFGHLSPAAGEMAQKMQVAEQAMMSGSVAARGLAGSLRLVVGVIGIKIAIIAGLIAVVVLLIRNWDQARAAAIRVWGGIKDYLMRIWLGLATAARGLGQIIFGALSFNMRGIMAGWDTLTSGLRQLGSVASDLGRGALGLLNAGLAKLTGQSKAAGAAAKAAAKDIKDLAVATAEAAARAAALVTIQATASVRAAEVAAAFARQRFGERQDVLRQLAEQIGRGELSMTATAQAAAAVVDELDNQLAAARALVSLEETRLELGVGTTEALESARVALVRQLEVAASLAKTEAERLRIQEEILRLTIRQTQAGIDWFRIELDAEPALRRFVDTFSGFVDDHIPGMIEGMQNAGISLREFGAKGAQALDPLMQAMLDIRDALEMAFTDLFTDLITGAKSFGESILGFFRNIVNSIINMMVQRMIVPFFLRLLGLERGAIIPGSLMPAFAMQHGGIINRPTFAMVGEGRNSEAVVPLPDNRSIPVTFTGRDREERPQEIVVRTTVVMDPRQIPPPQADEITNVVLMDIRSGGAVYREIRRAVGR